MVSGNDEISGKVRKRQAAKTPIRPSTLRVKASLHLSSEASTRLSVHAAMLNMGRSELVESLIVKHLRRFIVSDRGGEESGNTGME